MSPHPLDHNIRTFESYNHVQASAGAINGGKILSKIGRGLNRIGQKIFGKQNRERKALRDSYQHEQQDVRTQCQTQMNAMRQEIEQTVPGAYAEARTYPGQDERIQAPSLPANYGPSTAASSIPSSAPYPDPNTSPAPATETLPTTPSSNDTSTATTDYVAERPNTKQSEREAKYPSSEWPTNLWRGPHGLWVSGLPEDDNTDVLLKQYQNLRNSGVNTVFSIIPEGVNSAHQQAAQAAGIRLERASIYDSDKIAAALSRGEQCLIHCRGGQHRAPTTAANAYLRSGRATNIDEAFRMAGGRLENFFGGIEGQVYREGQRELMKLVEQAISNGINVGNSEIVHYLRRAGFPL